MAVTARNSAGQKEASTSVVLPGAPDDVCHQIIATKDGYALLTKFEVRLNILTSSLCVYCCCCCCCLRVSSPDAQVLGGV